MFEKLLFTNMKGLQQSEVLYTVSQTVLHLTQVEIYRHFSYTLTIQSRWRLIHVHVCIQYYECHRLEVSKSVHGYACVHVTF